MGERSERLAEEGGNDTVRGKQNRVTSLTISFDVCVGKVKWGWGGVDGEEGGYLGIRWKRILGGEREAGGLRGNTNPYDFAMGEKWRMQITSNQQVPGVIREYVHVVKSGFVQYITNNPS